MNCATALFLVLILAGWFHTADARAEARVAASIKPIHALVSAVMGDTGSPALILTSNSSPHGASLKPSQRRVMAEADIIFFISHEFETPLRKPLDQRQTEGAILVELIETPGLSLLPIREGVVWTGQEHNHDHDDHGVHDPHIWLDPVNARAMIDHIADILAKADPDNAAIYQSNAQRFAKELGKLNQDIAARLASVKERPFVVFHDGYQYFERRFGLSAVGAIAADPDKRPGAKRLRQIRQAIKTSNAVCVFAEPQFEVSYVSTVIEDTNARSAILDPIGITPVTGAAAYIEMMSDMADSFADCLIANQ